MNECNCKKCAYLCYRHPCGLLKEDFERLRKHFKLSRKLFFTEFCIVDYYMGSGEETDLYYVCLRRSDGQGGGCITSLGWAFPGKPCIFLKNNLCSVHKIKPIMGATAFGCKDALPIPSIDPHKNLKKMYAEHWGGELEGICKYVGVEEEELYYHTGEDPLLANFSNVLKQLKDL